METNNKEVKKPLGYLGGDIMSFGSNLARQYEYDKFKELNLDVNVYSPVMNKDINDKKSVTEEENNHLAEKITEQDIERLWNSDFVVIEPAQTAIGTMCELGTLYGWKYLTDNLKEIDKEDITVEEKYQKVMDEIKRLNDKDVYIHYFDIRNTQLNEKGWRRSFSINQLLYGMILYVAESGDVDSFDNILNKLKEKYGKG